MYHNSCYWPSEIERVISELSQVQQLCVVGIYNEQVGDEAWTLVVRNPKFTQEIVDHVARRLPDNTNGKTMRKEARDLFMAYLTRWKD